MKTTLKFLLAALLAGSVGSSFAADLEDDLQSTWESLWTQTGYPMRLTRWNLASDTPLKVRFKGYDVERQKDAALHALKDVSAAAGLAFLDVSGESADDNTAQIEIEFLSPLHTGDELPELFACVTNPKSNPRTGALESAHITVKNGQAFTCMYHELMHAMGIAGHPSGHTVLSYFPWRQDQLQEFDQKLLRAWYSPSVHTGTITLFAMDGLAESMVREHAKTSEDYTPLEQKKVAFLQKIEKEMESFAKGDGDIPTIVRRSGFASEQGVHAARTEMAFNLGLAYQRGLLVRHDLAVALQWYETAANHGHLYSHFILTGLYSDPNSMVRDPVRAYQWCALLSKKVEAPEIQTVLTELTAQLTPEQLETANAKVASFSYLNAP